MLIQAIDADIPHLAHGILSRLPCFGSHLVAASDFIQQPFLCLLGKGLFTHTLNYARRAGARGEPSGADHTAGSVVPHNSKVSASPGFDWSIRSNSQKLLTVTIG